MCSSCSGTRRKVTGFERSKVAPPLVTTNLLLVSLKSVLRESSIHPPRVNGAPLSESFAGSTTVHRRRPRETFCSSEDVSVLCGQIFQSKGLVSIDRSEAAALLSTTPRLRPRSSANDLAPLHCMGWISFRHTHSLFRAREEPCCCGFATADAEGGRSASIVASQRRGANGIVTFLGRILT